MASAAPSRRPGVGAALLYLAAAMMCHCRPSFAAPVVLRATSTNTPLVYRPVPGDVISVSAATGTVVQLGSDVDCAVARAGYLGGAGSATGSAVAPWVAANITITSYGSVVLCNGVLSGTFATTASPQQRSSLQLLRMQLADKSGVTVAALVKGNVTVTDSVMAGPVAVRGVEQGSTVVMRNVTVAPTDVATMAKDAFTVDGVLDDSTVALSYLTVAPYYTSTTGADSNNPICVRITGLAIRNPPRLVSITDCTVAAPYLQRLLPLALGASVFAIALQMNGPAVPPTDIVMARNRVQLWFALQSGAKITVAAISVTASFALPSRSILAQDNMVSIAVYWSGRVGTDGGGNVVGFYAAGSEEGGGAWTVVNNRIVLAFDTTSTEENMVPLMAIAFTVVPAQRDPRTNSDAAVTIARNYCSVASAYLRDGYYATLLAVSVNTVSVADRGGVVIADNVVALSAVNVFAIGIQWSASSARSVPPSYVHFTNNSGVLRMTGVSTGEQQASVALLQYIVVITEQSPARPTTIVEVRDNSFTHGFLFSSSTMPYGIAEVHAVGNRCACLCVYLGGADGTPHVSTSESAAGLTVLNVTRNVIPDDPSLTCRRAVVQTLFYDMPDLGLINLVDNAIYARSSAAASFAIIATFGVDFRGQKPDAIVYVAGNLIDAVAESGAILQFLPHATVGMITVANNTILANASLNANKSLNTVYFVNPGAVNVTETLLITGNTMNVTGYCVYCRFFDTGAGFEGANLTVTHNTVFSSESTLASITAVITSFGWARMKVLDVSKNRLSTPTCDFVTLIKIRKEDLEGFIDAPVASNAVCTVRDNVLTTWRGLWCSANDAVATAMITFVAPVWRNSTVTIAGNSLGEMPGKRSCEGMTAIAVDIMRTEGSVPAAIISNNTVELPMPNGRPLPRFGIQIAIGIGYHTCPYSVLVTKNIIVIGKTSGAIAATATFSTTSFQIVPAGMPPLLCATCESAPVLFRGNSHSVEGDRDLSALHVVGSGLRSGRVALVVEEETMLLVSRSSNNELPVAAIAFSVIDDNIGSVTVSSCDFTLRVQFKNVAGVLKNLPLAASLECHGNSILIDVLTGRAAIIITPSFNATFPVRAVVANNTLFSAFSVALLLIATSNTAPPLSVIDGLGLSRSSIEFSGNVVSQPVGVVVGFKALLVLYSLPLAQAVVLTFFNNTFTGGDMILGGGSNKNTAFTMIAVSPSSLLTPAANVAVIALCNRDNGLPVVTTLVDEVASPTGTVVRAKVMKCDPTETYSTTESRSRSEASLSRSPPSPTVSRTRTESRRTPSGTSPNSQTQSASINATLTVSNSGGSETRSGSGPTMTPSPSVSLSMPSPSQTRDSSSNTITQRRYLPPCNITSLSIRLTRHTADNGATPQLSADAINNPGVVLTVAAFGAIIEDDELRQGRTVPFNSNAVLATSVTACDAQGISLPDSRVAADGAAARFIALAMAGGGVALGGNGTLRIPLGPTTANAATATAPLVVVQDPQYVLVAFAPSAFDCDIVAGRRLGHHGEDTTNGIAASFVVEVLPSPYQPVTAAQTSGTIAGAISAFGAVVSGSPSSAADVQALAALAFVQCGTSTTSASARGPGFTLVPFRLGQGKLHDEDAAVLGLLALLAAFTAVHIIAVSIAKVVFTVMELRRRELVGGEAAGIDDVAGRGHHAARRMPSWRDACSVVRFPALSMLACSAAVPGLSLMALRSLFVHGAGPLALLGLALCALVPMAEWQAARRTAGAVSFVEGEDPDAVRFYRYTGASRWVATHVTWRGPWRRLAAELLPVGRWGPEKPRRRVGWVVSQYRQVWAIGFAPSRTLTSLLFTIVAAVPTEGGALCAVQFALLAFVQLGFTVMVAVVRPFRVGALAWWSVIGATSTVVGIIASGYLAVTRSANRHAINAIAASSAMVGFCGAVRLAQMLLTNCVDKWWKASGDGAIVPYYEGAATPSFTWDGVHQGAAENWDLSPELLLVAAGVGRESGGAKAAKEATPDIPSVDHTPAIPDASAASTATATVPEARDFPQAPTALPVFNAASHRRDQRVPLHRRAAQLRHAVTRAATRVAPSEPARHPRAAAPLVVTSSAADSGDVEMVSARRAAPTQPNTIVLGDSGGHAIDLHHVDPQPAIAIPVPVPTPAEVAPKHAPRRPLDAADVALL